MLKKLCGETLLDLWLCKTFYFNFYVFYMYCVYFIVCCQWRNKRWWQVYSVINRTSPEMWKIKRDERRQASSRALTAASVVRTRRRRSVCDGFDVIRRRRRSNPLPDTTPLVITLCSAAVVHRGTESGGYFCWKLTLTRTPDPIRPTRQGPDPNRPKNGSKQGGLWPRSVCQVGFGQTPLETIGDSRTEFYAIVNSKPQ